MNSYLLAVGGTGNKILESVVWAACADVLRTDDADGRPCPMAALDMLSVDVDAACGNTTRAMQSCGAYEQVRSLFDGFPYAHRGFHTALHLSQWDMDLSRRSASIRQLTENHQQDRLLGGALFDEAEASLQYSEGFRGHPDLGVLFFSDLLAHLEDADTAGRKDELLLLVRRVEEQLKAGERVKLLLCGSIFGGTGASGIPILSRFLRERFAPWLEQLEMGAVLMLPYYRVPAAPSEDSLEIVVSSDQFLDKARTALQYYGMEGMIRKSAEDKDGLYDAVFLLGLPEECFVTAQRYSTGSQSQLNDAHLLEWLASRCISRFYRTDYRADHGRNINCYYYQIASRRFGWEGFDEDAALYRRAYGGLLKASAAYLAEFGPVLESRIRTPRRLRDRTVNYYAAYFRRARRMKAEELDRLSRALTALNDCFRGYTAWVGQIIASLPPQLRNVDTREERERQAEEMYRRVTELSSQVALLERQAKESGMTEEKIVHRADMKDTEAEAMMAGIAKRRDALTGLKKQLDALYEEIGGQARLELLAREDKRLNGLNQKLSDRMTELSGQIDGEKRKPELSQDRARMQKQQSSLHRMEKQQAYIAEQLSKVQQDTQTAVMLDLRTIPPKGGNTESPLPGNDLFQPETLARVCALLTVSPEDRRAWGTLVQGLGKSLDKLVLSPAADRVTVSRLIDRLGDGAGSDRKASPLACFLAQLLELVMEEGH